MERRYDGIAQHIDDEGLRIAAATRLADLEPASRYLLARLFCDRSAFVDMARALLAAARGAPDPRATTLQWLEFNFAADADYAAKRRGLVEGLARVYDTADEPRRRAIMRLLGFDLTDGVWAPKRFRIRALRE